MLTFAPMKMKFPEEEAKIKALMDVIRDIRKGSRQHFMQKMKALDFDITIEMLEVLNILWNKDNINQQEIVEKTNRNKASLTSLIDNMTARGLVKRNPDPLDRRNNLIALTKEGEEYQYKIMPALAKIYRTFGAGLSVDELETTHRVLRKIYAQMTS